MVSGSAVLFYTRLVAICYVILLCIVSQKIILNRLYYIELDYSALSEFSVLHPFVTLNYMNVFCIISYFVLT